MRTLMMFAVLVLAAPVTFAENVPGVSGRWYMEGEENGTYIQYLVDRSDDGKFSAEIRLPKVCENESKPESWIETGSWSFRDGTLYNRTETVGGGAVNPDDPEYQDSFTITVTDDDHATAYDHETKITWQTRRVGADFKFPVLSDCSV